MPSIAGKAPVLGFIMMFPGFFLYHYLAGVQAIPLFVGGWASYANLAAALVLAPLTLYFTQRGWRTCHLPALAFASVVLAYALFFWRNGDDYQRSPELVVHSVKLILGLVAVYCVGFLMRDQAALKRSIIFALALMATLIIIHTDWRTLSFPIPERIVPSGQVSDYQGFATAFAITAVFAIAVARRLSYQLATIFGSVVCLFLIGSRGDMLGFGLSVCCLSVVGFMRRDYMRVVLAPIVYVAPILFFLSLPSLVSALDFQAIAWNQNNSEEIEESIDGEESPPMEGSFRNEELLDIGSSQSLGIRMEVLRTGLHGIASSPIAGDYAGQVRDHGQFGMYVHNILSAWQQYGLVGFLLYAGLSFGAVLFLAWRIIIKGDESFLMLATLYVSVYSVGLILLTKSVFWPMPALAWGMAAARYRDAHIASSSAIHPPEAQAEL